ncbi:GDSL-type esterase/lipase family protein [Paenibacillus algorifonticola]|uniref:GDSL-type esterase/lipase family protein n=1 Tax=Paenibacillus algorifonticola TaxID=684063 RepID=UPI003D2BB25E
MRVHSTEFEKTIRKFNFTAKSRPGFISVKYDLEQGAPLFNKATGYGFINQTSSSPSREVHAAQLEFDETGFFITEPEFEEEAGYEQDHFNNYGMAFRIQTPPGAYEIYVRTASKAEYTSITVSGMHADRLLTGGCWDAAGLIPIHTTAQQLSETEWSYRYVNGRSYIDIELEPRVQGIAVGLEEIVLTSIAPNARQQGKKPTVFILGDSTVKSYTFVEAPMSGWGQILPSMFDESKVKVLNYSMGGRSFKNAYWEGRLNDILMTACEGDFIVIQFGHNDESLDEHRRFGRGSTEAMYESFIRELYIPAIRARGITPLFVTAMSRVNGETALSGAYENSFQARRFPEIMLRLGTELDVTVLDLNTESLRYYHEIGGEATVASFMSIEAGETPGKTNDGTYANGHPANKVDGTHYKEVLSKQFSRMIVTLLAGKAAEGDPVASELASYLNEDVKAAIVSEQWCVVFPEMAQDTTKGRGSYYRNQIEKLIQLGVMEKDQNGFFHPELVITAGEFIRAMGRLTGLDEAHWSEYAAGDLTREAMGAIIVDAYHAKLRDKPDYMTAYNGQAVRAGDAGYDPNLDSGAQGLTYYPLVPFNQLEDSGQLTPKLAAKVKDAYELGLIRSEMGIRRGRLLNGTALEPLGLVTREKAAKALYFIWVLMNPSNMESQQSRKI